MPHKNAPHTKGRMISQREVRENQRRGVTLEEAGFYYSVRAFLDSHGKIEGNAHTIKGTVFPFDDNVTVERIQDLCDRLGKKAPLKSFKGPDGGWYVHDLGFAGANPGLRRLGADNLPSFKDIPDNSRSTPGVVPEHSGPEVEVEVEKDPKTFVGADAPQAPEKIASPLPPGSDAEGSKGAKSEAPVRAEGAETHQDEDRKKEPKSPHEGDPATSGDSGSKGSKSEAPKSEAVAARPKGFSKEVEVAAAAIYMAYMKSVRTGAKAAAVKSICKLLTGDKRKEPVSAELLLRCVDRAHQQWVVAEAREKQFRKQANNFFGLEAVYEDFLDDDWQAPTAGGNGTGAAGKPKKNRAEYEVLDNEPITTGDAHG